MGIECHRPPPRGVRPTYVDRQASAADTNRADNKVHADSEEFWPRFDPLRVRPTEGARAFLIGCGSSGVTMTRRGVLR